jgi:amidohydrolase
MNDLDRQIADVLPEIVRVRQDLHAHPQLGYEETYASDVVQKTLAASGVPFVAGLAETGVVGWLCPDHSRPGDAAVGLRADMDALPIAELTGLPYSSRNPGLMHACGHDGHTSVLLATAKILARYRNLLPRPVKFVFQPAEEFGAGAERMIEAGALSDRVGGHPVTAMFGLHGSPLLPVGMVATRPGPLLAGCVDFEVTLSGGGGHAAMPHLAADPVVASASIVSALQTLKSRNLDPVQPAVVSICTIHGGQAHNVIPDTVTFGGTIRAYSDDVFELMRRRLQELSTNIARGYGCDASVRFTPSYPPVVNDPKATAYAEQIAVRALGVDRLARMEAPVVASEDFAYYGNVVPSCFSFFGLIAPGRDRHPMLHTPLFDFTDAALETGVRLMCGYALGGGRF